MSTPGVIPYEFSYEYPFNSYDWPEWLETDEVKRDYIEITKMRVKKFFEKHGNHYKLIFAYFHLESETLQAIRLAFEELNMTDKLIVVLDYETYIKIKSELGKERVGASIVRHPLALSKLKEVLNKYLKC